MLTIRLFSEEAKAKLELDHDLLVVKATNPKTGVFKPSKFLELAMEYSDGEMVINDRAVPEPCGIAFEVARKCLLVKGAKSGDFKFFWYANELAHWYNRNFGGECPTRASDWYQNACEAVYEAIDKGVVVTRETVRVTKNALGNTLFYVLCQQTQKLSDCREERRIVVDIYGSDDKEPSVVIPYRDRYFADAIRDKMLANDEAFEDANKLDELDKEIVRLLANRNTQREIAEALNLSKGTAYRKVKALQDRFEGLLLQYNNR